MLPLKVLNRLRLGRDVAARISSTQPEHLAWVYVYPILDPRYGSLHRGHGREGYIIETGDGNAVKGFLVRHLEIDALIAEEYYQGQREELGDPFSDEMIDVANELELTIVLQRWLSDLTTLHVPDSVGYEFELGPDLLRRLKKPEPIHHTKK